MVSLLDKAWRSFCSSLPRKGSEIVRSNTLSVGVETAGGLMKVVIPRNTILPAKREVILSTRVNNQSSLLIQVFEGERALTKDNNLLGEFEIFGIPPAPRGIPKITVRFHIDEDGILNVSAEDKIVGAKKKMTISKRESSKEEIKKMVEEAERCKAADKSAKKKINAKRSLEEFAYDIEDTMRNNRFVKKLKPADNKKIQKAVHEAIELSGRNHELSKECVFKQKKKELEGLWNRVITNMYHGDGGDVITSDGGDEMPVFGFGKGGLGNAGPIFVTDPKMQEVD